MRSHMVGSATSKVGSAARKVSPAIREFGPATRKVEPATMEVVGMPRVVLKTYFKRNSAVHIPASYGGGTCSGIWHPDTATLCRRAHHAVVTPITLPLGGLRHAEGG